MTPKGRDREPSSPKRSGGEPPCGVDGIGDRGPDKGVKEKGMVFKATEGTMRQDTLGSPRQAAVIGNRPNSLIDTAFAIGSTSPASGWRASIYRHNPRLRAHRGGESERGAGPRNVSVERRRLAATSAAANPLASDKCAEKVVMELERQRPEPKRTGCGAVDGSSSGCCRVDEMEGATWKRAYPVNAGTHYI